MPTQSTTYNTRVTDEALEKRFRDTFRAQGGAELVDDLYAQGVIVPVVDFTAAATGTTLAQNLQTAWDFSTGNALQSGSGTTTAISNAGFWLVNVSATISFGTSAVELARLQINDGSTSKIVWRIQENLGSVNELFINTADSLVVFLRSGDSLQMDCSTNAEMYVSYRQIATVSGDLINPTGFTSS